MQFTPKDDNSPKNLLDWLGVSSTPNWAKARTLGGLAGIILTLLFLTAFIAAAAVLFGTIRDVRAATPAGPNLGAGALITALLGAPFLIWSTIIKHKSLGFQKEGHLTDRISKAVEQLGAEKKVDRIGRSVTALSGAARDYIAASMPEGTPDLDANERVVEMLGETADESGLIWEHKVRQWSERRTLIEWRGEVLKIEPHERVAETGEWQAFAETHANIEVRIGGILSLERIAQDSTAYDKGRDHVRCMEILCAYIRENARALTLEPSRPPYPRKNPRLDIQMALNVLKRRSLAQTNLEAAAKYRLDLRSTDFDGCDLSYGNFAGAILWHSRMEGTFFNRADLTGTRMQYSLLNFANFRDAILHGTDLSHCVVTANSGFPDLSVGAGKIHAIDIVGAELTGATLFPKQFPMAFGSKDSKVGNWDDTLEVAREELKALDEARRAANRDDDRDLILEIDAKKAKSIIAHWSDFTSNDLATNIAWQEFSKRHGLTGWPFED